MGSGLLRLDAWSVQTDPDGSRRIVWMINGMVKAVRHSALGHPDHADRCGAGTRYSIW
jgi:hypothetical protein